MFTESELRTLKYLSNPIEEEEIFNLKSLSEKDRAEIKEDLLIAEENADKTFISKLSDKYDTAESELILSNLKYIKKYCIENPVLFDGNFQIRNAPYSYFLNRDSTLEELGLTEDKFYNFTLLQEAITALGLEAQPTFEFIVFLYDLIKEDCKDTVVTCREKISNVLSIISKCSSEEKISMTIKVGSKSIEFHNQLFIKSLLGEYCHANTKSQYLLEREQNKKQQRIIQYSLLKTLLDNIPYHIEKSPEVKYTQNERNFCLCVLHYCKLLNGDPLVVCTKENNATFDKLMRDFKDFKIGSFLNITN